MESRRGFLSHVAAGWTLFTGACVAGAAMLARFFYPNDSFGKPTRFRIGSPAAYAASAEGVVSERYKSRGIFVVRDLDGIYVLAAVCTHLGCTPDWQEGERKFRCPCHGSGFHVDGVHFEGPAPRPLERYKVSIAPDGQIEVDTSRSFRQELGQWDDPDSFLPLKTTA